MLVIDTKITLSASEWVEFESLTSAPWKPRTTDEFNAMCELSRARHMAENTGGVGIIFALANEAMKFGANGEINFPADKRREEYAKVYGTWPTNEELATFENSSSPAGTPLRLVKNS